MSDECIHGLDDGLCAICFPKAPPEAASDAAAQKTVGNRTVGGALRRSPSSSSTTRAPKVATARASKPVATRTAQPVNVGEQRIYHVTHIKNLPGIVSRGILQSDSGEAGSPDLVVDIASPAAREKRRATALPGQDDSVASYVPFFLSPDARLWDTIRSREPDSRLSAETSGFAATEFVVLVSTLKDAFSAHADSDEHAPYSMTNGDSAGSLTRFGTGHEDTERMLRRLRADEQTGVLLDAEFLVKDAFPFELITLIGVKNERVRDEVKTLLAQSGQRARVAVYPPWFVRPDETAS